MRDRPAPDGFEVSGRDWWTEDSVTTALRAAKPKARSLRLTDAEANDYLDRFVFNKGTPDAKVS